MLNKEMSHLMHLAYTSHTDTDTQLYMGQIQAPYTVDIVVTDY